jgi:hypothetical protein
MRMLLGAFLDLEDVAFGVADVAPATASLSFPLDLGDRLHTASDKMVARGLDIGDREPDLVTGPVVLRLAAAPDKLEHTRFAEIELDPVRAGDQLGQSEHVAEE